MSDVAGTPSLRVEGNIAVISLNRPGQHNRMEPADIAAIHAHLARIDADPLIRAVIITARGRSFCSGYDIGSFGAAAQAGRDPGQDFSALCDQVEALRQPVIAALNGSVYGGAIDLALACDFRIGHDGMVMSVPAARLGLHYYGRGNVRYVSRLGLNAAKRLLLAVETFDAEAMIRCGFLDTIVAADLVFENAQALAQRLARHAPRATQGMKQALNAIAAQDADVAEMDARFAAALTSADFAEGRAAWAEKRNPRFSDPDV